MAVVEEASRECEIAQRIFAGTPPEEPAHVMRCLENHARAEHAQPDGQPHRSCWPAAFTGARRQIGAHSRTKPKSSPGSQHSKHSIWRK